MHRRIYFSGVFTCLLFLMSSVVVAQSAKKFFSSAEKFQEAQNYKDAVDNYTKAIKLDPDFEKAYTGRAFCYEKSDFKSEAIEDYERAIALSPKKKEYYYNAGRLYYTIGEYNNADKMLTKALEFDKGYMEAVQLRVKTLTRTRNYHEALTLSETILSDKKTAENYFNHALILDSLRSYLEAEKSYKRSKYYDSKYISAHVGLILVQLKMDKTADAFASCEAAFEKAPNDKDLLNARSYVYEKQKDYVNMVNDLTKVIIANPENVNAFYRRAYAYQKTGQFQNAINDYTKALITDTKNLAAYSNRAYCNEQIANFKAAGSDYEKILALSPFNEQTKAMLKEAKSKLFEYNREAHKPEIKLVNYSVSDKNTVKFVGNKDEVVIAGSIKDESNLKSITVNGINADFNKDTINPDFRIKINVAKQTELTIAAQDIYDNLQKITYAIERTETDKPVFALIAPATSSDNEIYLDNTNSELYIEGKVKDESLIKSIIIEGSSASYPLESLNPSFSAKINISNKTSIKISVKDINDNENVQEYKINREGALATQNNPMGVTWVIFIENSVYQNFSSLEGPAKDVVMLKSALANYKINKIIHKKDLSKGDLEKFFSIELRDLVKSNNVNSILIWYAGHGKFVNQTGYWIPVDAKVDDEFTYFNINNLRASMQSYSKIVHTLVITDACESGPSFYLAMRDTPKDRRCDDWESTKFKSSQVLSSAGYELAADNSQFTKTFSAALGNNPDGCISIEKIAAKVAAAVKQTSSQVPRLGKINGLEDEDGTFFFIKK